MRLWIPACAVLLVCAAGGCASLRGERTLCQSPDAVIRALSKALTTSDADLFWSLLSTSARQAKQGGVEELRRDMKNSSISDVRILSPHTGPMHHFLYPIEVTQAGSEKVVLNVLVGKCPGGWWIERVNAGQ